MLSLISGLLVVYGVAAAAFWAALVPTSKPVAPTDAPPAPEPSRVRPLLCEYSVNRIGSEVENPY
tara:strand:+ start:353 stop:547 length:195 start_codon:yes stop_codon:yes gene_type:complete